MFALFQVFGPDSITWNAAAGAMHKAAMSFGPYWCYSQAGLGLVSEDQTSASIILLPYGVE